MLDVVGHDGRIHPAATRLWPQTEAFKAYFTVQNQGKRLEPRVSNMVDDLTTGFFDECPAGTWRDRFDDTGLPAAHGVAASSLFHVFMAYAELSTLASGPAAKTLWD